jgi:hypothetical protein
MQNKLQELKNAIHKACPELLELSFGCSVKKIKQIFTGYYGFCVGEMTGDFKYEFLMDYSNQIQSFTESEIAEYFEILGHPIGIAEVLRALHVKIWVGIHYQISDGVLFCKGDKTLFEWHLKHDLDWHAENKPETIHFLHSIICK